MALEQGYMPIIEELRSKPINSKTSDKERCIIAMATLIYGEMLKRAVDRQKDGLEKSARETGQEDIK
jgi:hypothetical protein